FGIGPTAQASWFVLRHGTASAVEQIAHAESVPVGKERAAGERRRRLPAFQHFPVTGCAELFVSGLAPRGLISAKDSVPNRTPVLRRSEFHKSDYCCEYNPDPHLSHFTRRRAGRMQDTHRNSFRH